MTENLQNKKKIEEPSKKEEGHSGDERQCLFFYLA